MRVKQSKTITFLVELGEEVRRRRLSTRKSCKALADEIGITQQSLNYFERGVYNTRIDIVLLVCERLGIDIHEYFNKFRDDTIGKLKSIK